MSNVIEFSKGAFFAAGAFVNGVVWGLGLITLFDAIAR